MRQRTRSLTVTREELSELSSVDSGDVDDDEEKDIQNDIKVEEMKLIQNVWRQLPKNDTLPYNDRIKKIDWKKIAYEDYSEEDVKQLFHQIIQRTRTYRLLSEILKDVEKEIFSALPLPRKPMPAFLLYVEDNKEALKEKLNKGAFIKVAAEIFNSLPEDQKEIYRRKAKEIKRKYKDVVAKFNLEDKKLVKSKKKTLAHSPFTIFYEHLKESNSECHAGTARKKYAALTKDEKLKYILEFLNVKEGNKLNLEQYHQAQTTLSKDEIAILDEYEGRPKKLSAYNIFMKEYLSAHRDRDDLPWGELFKSAGDKWKHLPEYELSYYKKLSEKLKTDYNEGYNEFVKSLPMDRRQYEVNHKVRRKSKIGSHQDQEANGDQLEQNKTPSKKRKKKISKSDSNENIANIGIAPQSESPGKWKIKEEDIKSEFSDEVFLNKSKGKKRKNDSESTDINTSEDFDSYKDSKNKYQKSPENRGDFVVNKSEQTKSSKMATPVHPKQIKKQQKKNTDDDSSNLNVPIHPKQIKKQQKENTDDDSSNLNAPVHPKQFKKQQKKNTDDDSSNLNAPVHPKQIKKQRKKNTDDDSSNLNALNTNHSDSVKMPVKKEQKSVNKKYESDMESTDLTSVKYKNQVAMSPNTNDYTSPKKSKKKQTESPEKPSRPALPKKPPGSLFKYYAMEIYDGPIQKAKQSFRSLNVEQKKAIEKKYNKIKRKYLRDFEEFLKSLSTEEIEKLEETFQQSEEDKEVSDISTDSTTDFSDDD